MLLGFYDIYFIAFLMLSLSDTTVFMVTFCALYEENVQTFIYMEHVQYLSFINVIVFLVKVVTFYLLILVR